MGSCASVSKKSFSEVDSQEPSTTDAAYATPAGNRTETPARSNRGVLEGLRTRSTPVNVSHHGLARRGAQLTLRMLPPEAYQSTRTHQDHFIKDRSGSLFPRVRVERAMDQAAYHPYRFELDRTAIVKVAGFNGLTPNTQSTGHLYSTGTSQPNTLVVTDNMTACIAIACAAENIEPATGDRLPGAKVRVFHLLPFAHEELMPDEVLMSIRNYLEDTRQEGLTIRAAMHGGDTQGDMSISTAVALRNLLHELDVALEFDETCENRATNTPLGAVIRDDHSVQFVTQIVAAED
ncbi:type III effector [Ralstonia solanacearum]|nr:type III effector [Ralstonia pseudosolanacearum]NKA06356.1 RipBD-effector family protein [Ralstonia solanacearum]MCK4124300.1 type III effector [Ralstonia pseudosolanacearum]QIK19177.1 type III effector [Ralstonia solanacearum]QIK22791.1 type III effector [Ralstonia solanacearum]